MTRPSGFEKTNDERNAYRKRIYSKLKPKEIYNPNLFFNRAAELHWFDSLGFLIYRWRRFFSCLLNDESATRGRPYSYIILQNQAGIPVISLNLTPGPILRSRIRPLSHQRRRGNGPNPKIDPQIAFEKKKKSSNFFQNIIKNTVYYIFFFLKIKKSRIIKKYQFLQK